MDAGSELIIGVLCNLLELCTSELKGIQKAADEAGVSLYILPVGMVHTDYPGPAYQARIRGLLSSKRFSGLISFTNSLLPLAGKQGFEELLESWKDRPMVSLGAPIFNEPFIQIEQKKGLEDLLIHLFQDHAYKDPVFICAPEGSQDAALRNQSFHEACKTFKIPENAERFYKGNWSLLSGRQAVQEFWVRQQRRPDVIVCANDYMALGARQELQRLGVLIPEDVALSGFDGLRLSEQTQSSIASVEVPAEEAGHLALEHLIQILAGKKTPNLVLNSRFSPKASCGCTHILPDLRIPSLMRRLEPLPEALKYARIQECQLDKEILHNLDQQYYKRHVENMIAQVIRSFFRTKQVKNDAPEIKDLLGALGIGNFYLAVFGRTEGAIPHLSRLLVAWENWEPQNIPASGIEYISRELLPESLKSKRSQSLVFFPLNNGALHFGNVILDYRPNMEALFYTLSDRLSAALLWIEESRQLQLINEQLNEAKRRVETLSLTDELTGLHNRRGFVSLATQQVLYCRRLKQGFWLLYMDLDDLKSINDTWGHDEGDEAIRRASTLLRTVFRSSDICARLGGDEFTVLIPDGSPEDLEPLKQRLDENLQTLNAENKHPWHVSLSLGAIFSPPESKESFDQILKSADQLLYEEKRRRKQIRKN